MRTYLIAGTGFSALLNHLTLRAAGRLDGFDVVHAGQRCHWHDYPALLQMGQHPVLLQMPDATLSYAEPYCTAGAFANVLATLMKEIEQSAEVTNELIIKVKADGDGFIVQTNTRTRYVERLDICIGRGQTRRWRGQIDSDLQADYDSPQPSMAFTGEQFLNSSAPLREGGRLCIIGDGGVAAWCVQRALPIYSEIFWISDKQFGAAAFPPGGRNDDLLQAGAIRRTFIQPGNYDQYTYKITNRGEWVPQYKLTLAEGVVMNAVRLNDGKITIGLQMIDDTSMRRWRCVKADRTVLLAADLMRERFDQIVFAIGQQNDPLETGSVAALLQCVIPRVTEESQADQLGGCDTLPPIRDLRPYLLRSPRKNRLVGLRSPNGNMRVLGAAAVCHPVFGKATLDAMAAASDRDRIEAMFYNTLCCEAKQPDLIPAVIWTICEANGYDLRKGLPQKVAQSVARNLCPYDELAETDWRADLTWLGRRAQSAGPI